MSNVAGMIRTGIGGWTFAPWRGTFYPAGLPRKQELEYAASKLTTIEVNGTFYRTQKPETFARWASAAPAGFVFSLKAPRYVVNRKHLAGAGEAIERFVHSGITELGDKLGPILWQLPATKEFDAADFAAFLTLLPGEVNGRLLRHAVELRHTTFVCREAVTLCRGAGIAIVYGESERYPEIADITADFVYSRLQGGDGAIATGYSPEALDRWTARAKAWASGGAPTDLRWVDPPAGAPRAARDVYVYFIRGGKRRLPQAAMALRERIEKRSS